MISVEWENDQTCQSCRTEHVPHCASVTIVLTERIDEDSKHLRNFLLCSNCVADLIKRLR